MERLAKTGSGLKPLSIFGEGSILDVWQGTEYAYEVPFLGFNNEITRNIVYSKMIPLTHAPKTFLKIC